MRSLPSVALGYGVSDERQETRDERGECCEGGLQESGPGTGAGVTAL